METAGYKSINMENEFSKNFDEDMCRVCLSDNNLLPLFPEQEDCIDAGNCVLNMLILCSGLEASWNDRFPKHICNNCLEELFKSYDFWKKCRNSVDLLNKVIINLLTDKPNMYQKFSDNEICKLQHGKLKPSKSNHLELHKQESSINEGTIPDFLDYEILEIAENSSLADDILPYDTNVCRRNLDEFKDGQQAFDKVKHMSNKKEEDGVNQLNSCFKCNLIFLDYDEYLNHDCKKPLRKSYTCEFCGQKFITYDKMRKHTLRNHKDLRPHPCDICSKTFQYSLALEVHKRTHAAEKPFTCKVCSMSFKTRSLLSSHKLQHDNIQKYTCSLCDEDFDKYLNLRNHMKNHPEVCNINTKHLCQECGHTFKTRGYLHQHIATIHSDLKSFICKICNKAYKSKAYLQVHMRIHAPEKKYVCDHCGQKFTTWNLRSCHIRTHHSTARPFVCNICSKAFKFSGRLKIHLRQHSGEKPYACSQCSMAFVSSSCLRTHMVKHTGERKHPCPVCGKRFSRKHFIKQHMVIHSNERKYKCEICNKAYKYIHLLKIHIKSHFGQKA